VVLIGTGARVRGDGIGHGGQCMFKEWGRRRGSRGEEKSQVTLEFAFLVWSSFVELAGGCLLQIMVKMREELLIINRAPGPLVGGEAFYSPRVNYFPKTMSV
jgi:hypothetical protein